jgi:hypothetical protein
MGPNLPPQTVDGLTTLADIAAAVGGRHADILAELKTTAIAARQALDEAADIRSKLDEREQWVSAEIAKLLTEKDKFEEANKLWVAERESILVGMANSKQALNERELLVSQRFNDVLAREREANLLEEHLAVKAAELESGKVEVTELRRELEGRLSRLRDAIGD